MQSRFKPALEELGFRVEPAPNSPSLPQPIRFHPDSNLCRLGHRLFALYGDADDVPPTAYANGEFLYCSPPAAPAWPYDAGLNILPVKGHFLYCERSVHPDLFRRAVAMGLKPIPVRQGYCACSTALLSPDAALTGDAGIARALRALHMDVLQVDQRDILLPGYGNGFIGGCGGSPEPGVWICTGSLSAVAAGERIKSFASLHGVRIAELTDGPLTDCGGLCFL